MAVNTFTTNDTNAVKLWSRRLEVETLKATPIAPLIGTSANSIIHMKNELSKGPGDKVTFSLRMQLSGAGQTEGGTLEGNEEAMTLYADSLLVNELRHAVRVKGDWSISTQRIPFDLMMEAKDALVDWNARRMAVSFFNQVAGNTAQTNTIYTGNNATIAPSSGYIIRANALATDTLVAADTSATMELKYIDYAKEAALLADPMIRPVKVDGEEVYVCYLDPRQVTDLRRNTSTGEWLDIMKSAYMGSRAKNPIFDGSLGFYNGVVLRQAPEGMIPNGVTSGVADANCRRAVFLGAQAAACAFSKGGGPTTYNWREESFDYDDEKGVAMRTLFGMKKCQFNSTDYGAIVISTYAVAHT
jgi:N4-gp56 family major capsid protein